MPSWYIDKGGYQANTRVLFTIIEKYVYVINKITVQLNEYVCDSERCVFCSNNKDKTLNDEYSLIYFRF